MKRYKKIITGLILALICGIIPFINTAKVKALTVEEITTLNDLKNTTWTFNTTLNAPANTTDNTLYLNTVNYDQYVTGIISYGGQEQEITLLSQDSTLQIGRAIMSFSGNLWYLYVKNNESDTRGTEKLFYNFETQESILPGATYKIKFGNFPDNWLGEGNINSLKTDNGWDFIGWLKQNATLTDYQEPYKIIFNLNGGTSEQPADIEFYPNITISKNSLPIPTRENYKFLHWAWADTDNIEYAEPFTQESLTFTDTDIYMWAIWTLYDVNMVFHLNNILILDARLVFTELEQPEEIAGETIDKIAKIELIGDNVTTFKMIISTLSVNPMLESSSPYISYILNYSNHVEIGFNFNSEYLNSISATSLYNVAEWTNIEQDTSFNDYLEIYINKPGQVIEVELESAKLVNDDIDNINTGANAVFSIITNFLNINIGFLTVGSIIAVLLAVAVLGFIIKIWQGGNNG